VSENLLVAFLFKSLRQIGVIFDEVKKSEGPSLWRVMESWMHGRNWVRPKKNTYSCVSFVDSVCDYGFLSVYCQYG